MRHTSLRSSFLLLVLAITMSACFSIGNSEKEKETNEEDGPKIEGTITDGEGNEVEINNMEDAVNAISEALNGLNNGEKVEAVNFRELKKLLPMKVAGMKQTNIEGESSGMAGFKYSQATAEYRDGDASFDISIVDGAGFAGVMTGLAAWSLVEMDKESQDGYERTTTIDGHKAYEKYNSSTKDGQISILVEDRFIVHIEGNEVSEKDMKKALDALDLKRLTRSI